MMAFLLRVCTLLVDKKVSHEHLKVINLMIIYYDHMHYNIIMLYIYLCFINMFYYGNRNLCSFKGGKERNWSIVQVDIEDVGD